MTYALQRQSQRVVNLTASYLVAHLATRYQQWSYTCSYKKIQQYNDCWLLCCCLQWFSTRDFLSYTNVSNGIRQDINMKANCCKKNMWLLNWTPQEHVTDNKTFHCSYPVKPFYTNTVCWKATSVIYQWGEKGELRNEMKHCKVGLNPGGSFGFGYVFYHSQDTRFTMINVFLLMKPCKNGTWILWVAAQMVKKALCSSLVFMTLTDHLKENKCLIILLKV